ncbi:hypothetical protein HPB48_000255 [Haemaphysalis longicornis]|uniref:Uncharacterized protein n=1 Tax=Haemaphysalis longicornis TaxID=44386 RepID=A0A9J6GW73_HAELO|nr:hypothetical protein HPB48_000255 [Haemaphysalis longicornis]
MACVGSPVRIRAKMPFYPKQAKQLALNVVEALQKEGEISASLNSLVKRVAILTNVNQRSLYKWMTECKQTGKPLTPKKRLSGGRGGQRKKRMDNFALSVLRRVVPSFLNGTNSPACQNSRNISGMTTTCQLWCL